MPRYKEVKLPKPFGLDLRKQKLTTEMVLEWAEDQMTRGVPRQHLCEMLVGMAQHIRSDNVMRFTKDRNIHLILQNAIKAISNAERKLFTVMVDRNHNGRALIKAERYDEAIALYEANLRDGVRATQPYEHLRILYTRRGDYANAIRVCKAAIGTLNERNKSIGTHTAKCYDPDHLAHLVQLQEEAEIEAAEAQRKKP